MRNSLKKITALFMAALMLLVVLAVGALGDEQYSNSVTPGIGLYSILDPETPVVTYVFYNGETEYARQAVKDGETLYEPEAPVMEQDSTVFTGWYREDGTKFAEFGVQTVNEKATIKLYAHFAPAYYVYFYTPDGSTLKHTMSVSDTSSSIDVSDVTYDAGSTKKVTGWALTPNGTEDVSTNVTFLTGANSVSLYAIETEGYWVIFHTGEGSVVAPVFKAAGEKLLLSDVAKPSRTGFTFSGWYNNEAGTGDVIRQVNGAMDLYAKWDPTTVNYTVIHWWENADDDGYSFHESEQKSGETGAQTNAAAKSYPGFTVQAIEQTTIKGDGSTIVNVNYKRNTYTVEFYRWSSQWWGGEWQEITAKRITAKYGANIKASWPGGVWYVDQNHGYWEDSTAQAGLEIMPLDGMKFYGQVEDGNSPAYYYVEVLPGESGTVNYGDKTYKLDHTDYWPDGWRVTTEDRYEIKGFTFHNGTSIGQALKNAEFYYTRNSYDIIFINNGVLDKEYNRYFEQSIKDAYYEPTEPADKPGFIFEGWYDNELGEGNAYTFEGKTMPANNITLYAKWVAPEYTVSFSLGYDNAPTPPEDQTVPYKKTAQQPEEPIREGFTFSGWYDQDGNLFNFATLIIRNTNLTARWLSNSTFTVVYDANGGGGTPPLDSTSYADGAGATLQDKGELIAPEGTDKVFLGWATNPQATTADYQPGDNMVIAASNAIDGVITLYAVWGDQPTKTKLTYNANYIAEGASSAKTVQHTENDSSELLNNATIALYSDNTFKRQGYQLIGWSKTPGENEKDYDCGESVIVDNLGEDENILYAVWKRTAVDVTITKQVTGNMGDRSKSFNFNVKSSEAMGSGEGYTLSDDAKTATFTLSHDHSMTLKNVPIGATLNVTEEATGYSFSMTFNGMAASNPITVQEGSNAIVVTNNLDATPDTGVMMDSLPYILILAVVVAIGVIVFIRKRRNRDDD